MSRYSKAPRAPKPANPSKDAYAKASKFLCFALHSIPDQALLDSQGNAFGRYMNLWAKRGINEVSKGSTTIAYFLPRAVSLLPLPEAIGSNDAPYAIAYDFILNTSHCNGESYSVVAAYYGFVIATLPSHDWRRAQSFAALTRPSEALLYADRAIVNLATQHSERISSAEKPYKKFEKLRDLFIDQQATPEGQLAASFALREASKVLNLLSEGTIQ